MINLHRPAVDSSTLTVWTNLFPKEVGCCELLVLSFFIEIPIFNANSADRDKTPRSAASDLGLHCLPISLL